MKISGNIENLGKLQRGAFSEHPKLMSNCKYDNDMTTMTSDVISIPL